jgi:hypothetical protein
MKKLQKTPFKKQSIFFRYLPYCKEFKMSNAIDTMHVTNGVFESTIGLLLDIPGKTMDSTPVRTFKFLELGKSYTHKKDRMERFTFLQLATSSQMRRKEQYASVCTGSESPQDSQQT